MYLNEMALKLIEESPHKDSPVLSKNIYKNNMNRKMLAEKLTFLRKARDNSRSNGKTYKANAIDNVSRALTNAPASDPTLKKMIKTPLSDMEKSDKNNIFNYLPKKTLLPEKRLDGLKDRLDKENSNPNVYNNKLSNYVDKNDIKNYQTILRRLNNVTPINDNVFEMFKYQPRLAGVKREINPLLYYNQSKNSLKFY